MEYADETVFTALFKMIGKPPTFPRMQQLQGPRIHIPALLSIHRALFNSPSSLGYGRSYNRILNLNQEKYMYPLVRKCFVIRSQEDRDPGINRERFGCKVDEGRERKVARLMKAERRPLALQIQNRSTPRNPWYAQRHPKLEDMGSGSKVLQIILYRASPESLLISLMMIFHAFPFCAFLRTSRHCSKKQAAYFKGTKGTKRTKTHSLL